LDSVLVHYDPAIELILACDSSPYGVGAVLSHHPGGEEKPITLASRSLGVVEWKNSQLEKEWLAIIFGVKKFNQYLCGKRFIILSDHKPLQYNFKETAAIPPLVSARTQCWLSCWEATTTPYPTNRTAAR